MKKNNAWDIGRLVDNSFVQANQRTSVLYCRLTNFKLSTLKEAFGGRNMKKKNKVICNLGCSDSATLFRIF